VMILRSIKKTKYKSVELRDPINGIKSNGLCKK